MIVSRKKTMNFSVDAADDDGDSVDNDWLNFSSLPELWKWLKIVIIFGYIMFVFMLFFVWKINWHPKIVCFGSSSIDLTLSFLPHHHLATSSIWEGERREYWIAFSITKEWFIKFIHFIFERNSKQNRKQKQKNFLSIIFNVWKLPLNHYHQVCKSYTHKKNFYLNVFPKMMMACGFFHHHHHHHQQQQQQQESFRSPSLSHYY